jgi:hypothetical protein
MNKQELFDKYDIVEGFIPLKDTVVYAIELKKLNIKAAYEITLFDGVSYVYDEENPNKSALAKSTLPGIAANLDQCFIQRLNEDASGNTEGVEPHCVLAFHPFPEQNFISGLANLPLLQDAVDATLQLSSPQDTKLLRKKHENQKLMKTSQ